MIKFRLIGLPDEVDSVLEVLRAAPDLRVRTSGRRVAHEGEGQVIQYGLAGRATTASEEDGGGRR